MNPLPHPAQGNGLAHARMAATEAAIRRIEQLLAQPTSDPAQDDLRAEAGMYLLDFYRQRLDYGDPISQKAVHMQGLEQARKELRRQALAAKRNELYRLRRTHSIDDEIHRQLVHEIDLLEASLTL